MKPSIAIIGGGAAGLMAAAALSELDIDADIHLFEKNKILGAKVLISGGGRCNVTTGIYKNNELLKNYPRGSEFLKYTFSKFGPKKIKSWFEDHGVKLKEEANNRIFPVSNKGSDIVGIFENIFGNKKVNLHFGENIISIKKTNKKFDLLSNISSYKFDYIVITTGGNAYSHTGSTGDGYTFASSCGHHITKLGPSLNSFLTLENWTHKLSGQSFQNANLSIDLNGKKISTSGSILLTHFGISGPATFVISSYSAFEIIDERNPLKISIKPYSEYDFERRNNFLLEAINNQAKKELQTILIQKFSKSFIEEFLNQEKIDPKQYMSQITKDTRKNISNKLGNGIILNATSRRPGDEFVTAGGVDLSKVNNQTMESLICEGLYFAGEILDIDGFTGGFNLQSSRATGMLAGISIGEKIKNRVITSVLN